MLVAGVTGGASLIESARIRAFINEMYGYEKELNAFVAAKGRLPGDLNNDGYIGECFKGPTACEQTYTINDFTAPYNTATSKPNYFVAPFVDMCLEKVSDFCPDPDNMQTPHSNILKDSEIHHFTMGSNSSLSNNEYSYNLKYGTIAIRYSHDKQISPQILKKTDVKIDDGLYNYGKFVSRCTGTNAIGENSYDDSIAKKGYCTHSLYKIY